MRDISVDIIELGINAGKVWRTLDSCGPLMETQIIENTGLSTEEFHAAVGWLARENKICKDGELFKLGETNLTVRIGGNAGRIWNAHHNSQGKIDILHASKMVQMEEKDVFSALGWLAREKKIDTNMENDELKSAKLEVGFLREELETLNADLELRNQIIKEMSTQLTDRQTQFVENVGIAERLQMELNQNQIRIKDVNERLSKRENDISRLQKELRNGVTNIEHASTLFDENHPLTSIQKQQDTFKLGEEDKLGGNLDKNGKGEIFDKVDTFNDATTTLKTKTLLDDESE